MFYIILIESICSYLKFSEKNEIVLIKSNKYEKFQRKIETFSLIFYREDTKEIF